MMTSEQSASILARMFGYSGPTDQRSIDQFLAANPAAASRMGKYQETMKQMVGSNPIRGFQEGGMVDQSFFESPEYRSFRDNPANMSGTRDVYESSVFGTMPSGSIGRAQEQAYFDYLRRTNLNSPQIPVEGPALSPPLLAQKSMFDVSGQSGFPQQQPSLESLQLGQQQLAAQASQPLQQAFINQMQTAPGLIQPGAGQTSAPTPTIPTAVVSTAQQATPAIPTPASLMEAATAAPQVQAATAALQPAQGQVAPEAQVQAAQQTQTSVSNLEAAQGTAILMDNPVQRQIQDGELVTGAADAAKAASFTEQVQAAEASPSKQATVQGQLEGLMTQFEGGATPAWAAGAMRAATATMAARGLGASSLAGQAIVQAAMESALPIAAADAQTVAQFEVQNLSNRQQRAMLAAQQRAAFIGQEFDQAFQSRVANAARIADVANMNFTAEQQVALENSRIANTVNLQNLNNRQAMVLAEASALSNLDISNLNNRQQAAVQNAQNFLQVDLTNLSNQQQTELFKTQQNVQALFTDQAARNAAAQFNASSENQTEQFFQSLASQTSQFNAVQTNALNQFNAGQTNAVAQFNAELRQQRDLFNAQNSLIVEQANAQWRQNVTTINTAAQNEANMEFAKTVNALSSASLAQIWQRERDVMSYAFTAQQSGMDRQLAILLADKDMQAVREQIDSKESTYKSAFMTDLLFGGGGKSSGSIFDIF